MPLFIDRLPFQHRAIQRGSQRRLAWYALLPAIIADPALRAPPRGALCRPWKFDSGCALDSCAWRFHLENAGLDVDAPEALDAAEATIRVANDATEKLPIRQASLWLVSNIPVLRPTPYRLNLDPGVPFFNRSPRRAGDIFPLIGMQTFLRAGLQVHLDFGAGTVSVWTPGPWHRSLSLLIRQFPSRYGTIPFEQLCQAWG